MKYAVIVTYTTGEKTGATVTASLGAAAAGTRFLKCSIRPMCAAWRWPRS